MTGTAHNAPPDGEGREAILHRLGERVKELTALHSLARIFVQPKPVDGLLQEVVAILPPAWQYPEIATARIAFDGREYTTPDFREGPWSQRAVFASADGRPGAIEVFYTREAPPEAEGPFLAEERRLLESLAEMLRVYIDRRIAEEALLESEERFRITFEQAAVGIVHAGLDGRLLRANRRFCDIMGYTYDDVIGTTLQGITCAHDVGLEMEYCQKLLDNRVNSYRLEKRNIRKDGRPVWVMETASLVRDPSGRPGYFIFVLEDVTEHRAAEAERGRLVHALQERVKELTAMYRTMEVLQQRKPVPELLRDVVALLPAAWQYPEIAAARIRFDDRDYATPNYAGSPWLQAARFRTYDAYDGVVEVAYLEERPPEAEGPFLAEERDLIESIARALAGALNRIKAEAAVADSEALYRALADASHDLVYIKDASGRFTYFNGFAADILAESPGEYVGKTNAGLYGPASATRHDAYELEVRRTGEPVYFEELTDFPRNRLWTANWLVPIPDTGGGEAEVLGVVRDIDGRKRAEQTLLWAEKALEGQRRLSGQALGEIDECVALLDGGGGQGTAAGAVDAPRICEKLKKAAELLRLPEMR